MPPRRPRNLRKTKDSMADWDDSKVTQGVPSESPADTRKKPLSQTARIASSSGNSKETEDVAGGISVDDLREFQKYRRHKQHGVDVEALARGERRRRQLKSGHVLDGSSRGSVEDKDDGSSGAASRSLSGAFTAQTNKLDANKHMMSYIEKEMEKHRSTGNHNEDTKDLDHMDGSRSQQAPRASNNNNDDDDDPYRVPSHLKVIDEKPLSEGNVAMAAKMLTSIQEVDLGAASRAKNIRETNMLVSQAKRGTYGGSSEKSRESTTGSVHTSLVYNSNNEPRFKQHTDFSERSSRATDDIALQRFKKRMRR
ncbi:hypothetical protein IW140_004024 [Coemansia sp. RSA 1813]|nr:hypothetical protein EV178_003959 [Coemansia sp. RSA 1646]KAJ1771137.1 hypothetical protein LPJ74_002630 [Coemansia sp. RSA 1843]KAJ2088473.1 hypothetical protein IW138_004161 [Coemansia sp. RSA 986]KAJ2217066.1 hypothetical protein EV179_000833 [Coemansia sp. RSA 487]KAJ2568296.1 hypothetical protein IW140_004024 [Coemansia sp. RSA 1813]